MSKPNSRSFNYLLASQFLGAFNDNAFKIIISLLVLHYSVKHGAGAALISLVGGLFIIPFIIFSPLAGFLADKYSKRDITVWVKFAEILIMILGLVALLSGNILVLCVVLFLMASQSAFFSPAKYGILPELFEETEISRANGHLQLWTFVAIILGTAIGARLKSYFDPNVWQSSLVLIALAFLGYLSSLKIAQLKAQSPDQSFNLNGIKQTIEIFSEIKQSKAMFLSLLAIAYFWFVGSVFQMNILLYAKNILDVGDSQTGLMMAILSLGIGLGSVLAGRMSEGKIEFGLVPMGALGLTIFTLLIGLKEMTYLNVCIVLFLLGSSAGFYTIPLNAYFQENSPEQSRGKFLATLSIANSFAMLAGSLFVFCIGHLLKLNAATTFAILGLLTLGTTVYILKTLPIAFVRLVIWILSHSLYKIKKFDCHNLPECGGALLVSNHISYIDALIIMATIKRPVRFMMYRKIYEMPHLNWLFRVMKVIPVSYEDGPKGIVNSLKEARAAIESGDLVCIFPEGGLTRTGNLLAFNRGYEKIIKGLDEPIVPLYLDNIWGSIFSFSQGRYFFKMPQKTPYPVSVLFGEPLNSDTKVFQLRLTVQELGAKACELRGIYRKKLHLAFIDQVKKSKFKFCMADSSGIKMNYVQALATVLVLKEKLFPAKRRPMQSNEMVGVLLPASVMASLANGAILFAGKIPVNLNFTLSQENLDDSIKQCSMKMIITSRKFIEKLNLPLRDEMVFLEDIKEDITYFAKLRALLKSLLLPKSLISKFCVDGDLNNVDDVATVIFSSGSTGQAKGVMLSHANIFSNIEAFYQIFDIKKNDVVMGALPFFHSFGFTATMCFPVGAGIGVVYHNNPMDAGVIGKLVAKYKASILMGTPTFLSAYLRKCSKEQFATVRHAVVGAEKLKDKLAESFEEKYGIRPLEGYGSTELSPIVAVGAPGYFNRKEHIKQLGNKAGSVGQAIPGVVTKVVDPDTYELLEPDQEGLLLIKGPNVMKGYLNNPQKTAEVIKDAWYISGDIAKIDEDGFITITDRLSRFSKIGGEMVPHIKVEEKIMEFLGAVEPICAVSSVSDEKKGERLVVLYSGEQDIDKLWDQLNLSELPKLWIPKKDSFIKVDQIPVLGTGKLDLKGIKTLAQKNFK